MCDVEHRGLLFDAGEDALVGRLGWELGPARGLERAEHGGATWARVMQRNVPISFVLPESARIFVSARALGRSARSAAVYLDDQPLGTLTFSRAEPKVATTATTTLPADAGLHTISLRFGRARDGEGFADIDWIRVGVPDDSTATFGALTARDLVLPSAAIGGVPHRSIALRNPGAYRCTLRPGASSVLEVAAGLSSGGEGAVSLVVTRDGHKPEVIAQSKVTGGEKGAWTDLRASLSPFADQIVTVSLVADRAPKGVRVLFGDPRVVDSVARGGAGEPGARGGGGGAERGGARGSARVGDGEPGRAAGAVGSGAQRDGVPGAPGALDGDGFGDGVARDGAAAGGAHVDRSGDAAPRGADDGGGGGARRGGAHGDVHGGAVLVQGVRDGAGMGEAGGARADVGGRGDDTARRGGGVGGGDREGGERAEAADVGARARRASAVGGDAEGARRRWSRRTTRGRSSRGGRGRRSRRRGRRRTGTCCRRRIGTG